MLTPELLDILACPLCKNRLIPDNGNLSLHCPSCNCCYPVIEGLPIMLPEQANPCGRTTGTVA